MTSHPAAEAFGATLTPGTRPAVLAVDLMRAYFDPASPLFLPDDACLHSAARVLEAARAHDVPVVHTRVSYGPGGLDGGVFFRKVPALAQLVGDSPMGELMPQVAPRGDELVVVKQYASAFFGTTLATTLHAAGIDTVARRGREHQRLRPRERGGRDPARLRARWSWRTRVGDRAPEPHVANLDDLRTKYAEVVDEATAIAYLEGAS